MPRITLTLVLLTLFAWTAPPASAADGDTIDWPTFQGNNARTGVCDYPALKNPEIAWSTRIGIMGYLNCPVIDGDYVYVTSSGSKHNETDMFDGLYCFNLKTGRLLWFFETPIDACGISISKDHIFIGDDKGNMRSIDRETRKEVWKFDGFGSAFAQPLVLKDTVIVSSGKVTSAISHDRERVFWTYKADSEVRGGISGDGETIYAAYTNGRIVGLKHDGEPAWEQDVDGQLKEFREIYPAPTVSDDGLFFGFARNTYYDVPPLFSLKKDGTLSWANQANDFQSAEGESFGNIRTSPALYEGSLIYAAPYGNTLLWVDAANGKVQKAVEVGAPMFPQWPSPVIASDTLYLARHDGGLYALDAKTGKQQWMMYLGDKELAGQDHLPKNIMPEGWEHCAWDPGVGKPLYATPAIAKDGTIVIGTGDGWLYCIKEKQ